MYYAELVERALAVCDKYYPPLLVEPLPVEPVQSVELVKRAKQRNSL